MRVEATRQAASGQSGQSGFAGNLNREAKRQRNAADTSATSESRALVVTETAAEAAPLTPVYREAAFLAHLIATKEFAPQTRERRRAEPSEAIAAYRTMSALTN